MYYQGCIELPKAARGHATHIDGMVLNVTKFRIQILYSLHCVMGRSAHAIEVISTSTVWAGGLTRNTRIFIFSNI